MSQNFVLAACVALRHKTFLFDHDAFQTTGAIFWPDYRELDTSSEIFDVFGVARYGRFCGECLFAELAHFGQLYDGRPLLFLN